MSSLDLKTEGPTGHTLSDNTFHLLRGFPQPDTALILESTAQSILDLLAEKDPQSTEIWSFGEICIELAEQIPYHHPSQLKLVALLEYRYFDETRPDRRFKRKYPGVFRGSGFQLSLTIPRIRIRANMSGTSAWESPSGIL